MFLASGLSPAALVAGVTKISLRDNFFYLGWVVLYSVYLSARFSLPVTLLTFKLKVFAIFGSIYFCLFLLFLQKSGGGLKTSAPPSAWSLEAGTFRQSQLKMNHKYHLITEDDPVGKLLLFCNNNNNNNNNEKYKLNNNNKNINITENFISKYKTTINILHYYHKSYIKNV